MTAQKRARGFLPRAAMCAAVAAIGMAAASGYAQGHICNSSCKKVWIPPVIEKQVREVQIPAKYETVTRQVWREPVYEDRRVAVELPADVVVHRRPKLDSCGRVIGYELINYVRQPARMIWQTQRVLVKPGCWETVTERVCVRPARTEFVYEDVEVRPGHWSYACGRRDGRDDTAVRPGGPASGHDVFVRGHNDTAAGGFEGWGFDSNDRRDGLDFRGQGDWRGNNDRGRDGAGFGDFRGGGDGRDWEGREGDGRRFGAGTASNQLRGSIPFRGSIPQRSVAGAPQRR